MHARSSVLPLNYLPPSKSSKFKQELFMLFPCVLFMPVQCLFPLDCSKPPHSGLSPSIQILCHEIQMLFSYDGSQDCPCTVLKTFVFLPLQRKKSSPLTRCYLPWHWYLRNRDGSLSEFQILKPPRNARVHPYNPSTLEGRDRDEELRAFSLPVHGILFHWMRLEK